MLTAEVLTVTSGTGGVLITVACPVCRRRHRHHWPPGRREPGIRESHCSKRRELYQIGQVPSDYLLAAAADLRRAAGYLYRHPWMSTFDPEDLERVADAARRLVRAVDTAIDRTWK